MTAAISADGRHVITRSGFRPAVLWDVDTAARVKQFDWSLFGRSQGTVVPPERWTLALGGKEPDTFIKVFDLATLRGLGVLEDFDGSGMFCLDGFSADGKWLVTDRHEPGRRCFARVWDTATGKVVRQLGPLNDSVRCAAFSPDRSRLYAVMPDEHGDSPTRVWRTDTWDVLRDRKFDMASEKRISISPDGRFGALTGHDPDFTYHVEIWDAELAERRAKVEGHGSFVDAAAFLPVQKGYRVVTAGDGVGATGPAANTVRIWECGER